MKTTRKIINQTFLLVFASLVLSACGFHLRGTAILPEAVSNLHVNFGDYPERRFRQALEEKLKRAGAQLNPSAETADYILSVSEPVVRQRAASLARDATAAEYELRMSVDYSLTNAAGEVVIPSTSIERYQSYEHDENLVIAKEREATRVKQDLYEQISIGIIAGLYPFDQARIDQAIRENNTDDDNPAP